MLRLIQKLLSFSCQHKCISWPRTDNRGCYVRCLDCGKRVSYKLGWGRTA